MRLNMPVTQREYVLRDGIAIISKTDAKGRITHVNRDFVESSGYTESELIGQPHNLLRHPDMPAEAFRDLWETIRAGRPWSGLVKNRRKDGDHYWVRASVTPLEDGGYMSVRQKPGREEVLEAERLYRAMREGNSRIALFHGRPLHPRSRPVARALSRPPQRRPQAVGHLGVRPAAVGAAGDGGDPGGRPRHGQPALGL